MNKNVLKIVLIAVLVLIVGGIVFVAINSSSGKREEKVNTANTTVEKKTDTGSVLSNTSNVNTSNIDKEVKPTKVIQAEDGVIYSLTDEPINVDIVIGDNYFDTTLADINTNFSDYEGKVIEVEGMYLVNSPYTFIGRYSESNLCAYCPVGYSYFEYEWHGDKEFDFVEGGPEWLKIKGTLKKGNDGVEYNYIDVLSLEVMNERGLETVKN